MLVRKFLLGLLASVVAANVTFLLIRSASAVVLSQNFMVTQFFTAKIDINTDPIVPGTDLDGFRFFFVYANDAPISLFGRGCSSCNNKIQIQVGLQGFGTKSFSRFEYYVADLTINVFDIAGNSLGGRSLPSTTIATGGHGIGMAFDLPFSFASIAVDFSPVLSSLGSFPPSEAAPPPYLKVRTYNVSTIDTPLPNTLTMMLISLAGFYAVKLRQAARRRRVSSIELAFRTLST